MVTKFEKARDKVWKSMIGWRRIFSFLISNTVKILINPSYLMFSLVAISMATLGVWMEFLPGGFSPSDKWYKQLNNMSVFTFCIALLGSMAVEYVFDSKGDESKFDADKELQKHLAFFFWFLALILSFAALESDWGKLFGLSSTILLWFYVNSHRDRFNRLNSDALNALNPNLRAADNEELGGEGLK